MPGDERRQDGEQPLLDGRGLERGEEHDEARWWWRLTTSEARADQSASTMPGLDGRQRCRPVGEQGARSDDPTTRRADPLVAGDDVDPVMGVTGERGEEQRASIAASSRGTSPTRPALVREVSRTMTMRRCCSGCQVRTTTDPPARGGPPVDRPDVVALDVVA